MSASAAPAQMAVHVVAGVVKSSDHGTVVVATGGDEGRFQVGNATALDATLREGTVAPSAFNIVGETVLLYYTGYDDNRTAVAVRDLGSRPYMRATGTVTAYDKQTRVVSLKGDDGKEMSLTLDPNLVLDADQGVENGRKFSPHKGDRVRVVFGGVTQDTVVLLGEML